MASEILNIIILLYTYVPCGDKVSMLTHAHTQTPEEG